MCCAMFFFIVSIFSLIYGNEFLNDLISKMNVELEIKSWMDETYVEKKPKLWQIMKNTTKREEKPIEPPNHNEEKDILDNDVSIKNVPLTEVSRFTSKIYDKVNYFIDGPDDSNSQYEVKDYKRKNRSYTDIKKFYSTNTELSESGMEESKLDINDSTMKINPVKFQTN